MAACYDAKNKTSVEVQQCVDVSARYVQSVQNVIQREMNDFQGRIERCSYACQDEVKDKYGVLTEASPNVTAAQGTMLKCMSGCVDKHIAILKSVQSRVEKEIDLAKR